MGIDLKNMTAGEAFVYAKLLANASNKQIVAALEQEKVNLELPSVQRMFNGNDNYFPSYPTLPGFCRALQNTVIIDWLNVQIAEQREVPGLQTGFEVTCELARLTQKVGELAACIVRALEDKRISSQEAQEIRGELFAVRDKAQSIADALQPVAGQKYEAGKWIKTYIQAED